MTTHADRISNELLTFRIHIYTFTVSESKDLYIDLDSHQYVTGKQIMLQENSPEQSVSRTCLSGMNIHYWESGEGDYTKKYVQSNQLTMGFQNCQYILFNHGIAMYTTPEAAVLGTSESKANCCEMQEIVRTIALMQQN